MASHVDDDKFQVYHQQHEQEQRVEEEEGGASHIAGSDTALTDEAGAAEAAFMFPAIQERRTASSMLFPWQLPPVRNQERFLPPLPIPPVPPPPAFYSYSSDHYARLGSGSGALHFAYGVGGLSSPSSTSYPLGLAGLYMGPEGFFRRRELVPAAATANSPFGALHAELGRMTQQEIMDAKALAASKSHSEAERRRRERINAHLARLRSLLPSTTKTDKASLLAEVIQHVKELKRQTSEIADGESPLPTETDELIVDAAVDEEGRLVVRASLCCDDRSDLLPDLIKALKALKFRALKAEITTLAGRIKHVLLITADVVDGAADQPHDRVHSVAAVQDALKAVMERTSSSSSSSLSVNAADPSGGSKRQRTTNLCSLLEHRSI